MKIDKNWFLLLAVAVSAVSARRSRRQLRRRQDRDAHHDQHADDLKSWENEGGNLAPPGDVDASVTSSRRDAIRSRSADRAARIFQLNERATNMKTNAETPAVGPHFGGGGLRGRRPDHVLLGRQLRRPAVHRRSAGVELRAQRLQRPGQFGGRARRPVGDLPRCRISRRMQRSSLRAPIPISARTPIASAPCARSMGDIPTRVRATTSDRDYRDRNRDARATLYEGPNLSGRAFPINEAVANLGRTGSTTARLRCASKAATGSSAAIPSSAASAARSVRATMRRCRGSTM